MSNRLRDEKSPYLLQHQDNPVAWYPWGDEAFLRAKNENKLVFLSVGYSACHWCHVMEHESFEHVETANYLNEHFISIKVDREERPDIDQIYQLAHQVLQRRAGGWPLSMFLTPEREPIVGGTYFPLERRFGMPSFREVLASVVTAWSERKPEVLAQAAELTEVLKDATTLPANGADLSKHHLRVAVAHAMRSADRVNGGFGKLPKFPSPMNAYVWAMGAVFHHDPSAQEQWLLTLDRMAQGGMYDHLGGGFARYSTDERWLIPHFEKMLYDNAQLLSLYLDGYKLLSESSDPRSLARRQSYGQTIRETVAYLGREMVDPSTGAFFSAQDADSEGEEGKFFTWNPAEIRDVLGEGFSVDALCTYWGVTAEGNFEHGKSALWTPRWIGAVADEYKLNVEDFTLEIARAKELLFNARSKRIRPGTDDKCLGLWNALTIIALAEAGATLGEPDWIAMAERALTAWHSRAWTESSGALAHAMKAEVAYGTAFLDDVAGVGLAALSVYEMAGVEKWFLFAKNLADTLVSHFWSETEQCFFFTRSDGEHVLHRAREFFDHAQPSGVALACELLLRLHAMTGLEEYRRIAELQLKRLVPMACERAMGMASTVRSMDHAIRGAIEIVIVAPLESAATTELLQAAHNVFLPHRVIVLAPTVQAAVSMGLSLALVEGRASNLANPSDAPLCYLCHAGVCLPPVTSPEQLQQKLRELRDR